MKSFKFILVNILLLGSLIGSGQDTDSLERSLDNTYGLKKLITLNILVEQYTDQSQRKALRYARQAVTLGENIFVESNSTIDFSQIGELTRSYFQLGKLLYDREDYLSAQNYFESAGELSRQTDNYRYMTETRRYLNQIQEKVQQGEVKENFFSKNFGDLKLGEAIRESSKDVKIKSEIGLGRMFENRADYGVAMDHYNNAINLLRDKGDAVQIAELQVKVGALLDSLKQYESAQEFLTEALDEADSMTAARTDSSGKEPVIANSSTGFRDSLRSAQKDLKDLSERYAREEDFEKSMEYFQLYQQLTQKMAEDSTQMAALNERREAEMMLLRQQKSIADLQVKSAELEKARAQGLRNTYLALALIILVATAIVLYFYFAKRKQHSALEVAYKDLNHTKSRLEKAEKRIVNLLRQQVSGSVATELMERGADHPVEKRFVCVMFLDIRDFTPMAEKLVPEQLIQFQNNVFGFMIDIVEKYKGTLNQLLGDGFMATFGAPVTNGNDCQNAYDASLSIIKELEKRNNSGVLSGIKVGIGLHAGNVVTGNVGNEMRKQYSVTGNPVITASRVEQLNKNYKSQLIITKEVYDMLDASVVTSPEFIKVKVKGRTEPVDILTIA